MTFKESARPLGFILAWAGLVAAAVSHAFGHPFPEWFISIASVYIVGWGTERGVTKAKGKE